MLVRSSLETEIPGGTTQCNRGRCLTFIVDNQHVIGPKGHVVVKDTFTCTSEGVVYAIECKMSGSSYVGETGRRLADRFREHQNNVLKNRTDNEIASHFNQDDHGVEDMQVCGVLSIRDIKSRKLAEQKLIARLGCFFFFLQWHECRF